MRTDHHSRFAVRFFAAVGAFACAFAVALGAYAAHGVSDAGAKSRLDSAVLYLLVHGLALCIFAPRQSGRMEWWSLLGWFAGMVLFCGSLVGATLWNMPTMLAPAGGSLLILSWLLQGAASLWR